MSELVLVDVYVPEKGTGEVLVVQGAKKEVYEALKEAGLQDYSVEEVRRVMTDKGFQVLDISHISVDPFDGVLD